MEPVVRDVEACGARPARLVLGVLGGMGPAAAAYFCLRLAEIEKAARDQDHLHVILDSDPSVPDRTEFLLGGPNDPVPALVTIAKRLVRAGAELLVMPCNSASPFTDQVAAAVSVPMVDWAGEAANAVVTANPDVTAIGLLATEGTLRSGIYQTRMHSLGATVLAPDEPSQQLISDIIYQVKAGTAQKPRTVDTALAVAQDLAVRGAGALLVACTELSLLIAAARATGAIAPGLEPAASPTADSQASLPVPVTDALEAVARQTIALAGGSLRGECLTGRDAARRA